MAGNEAISFLSILLSFGAEAVYRRNSISCSGDKGEKLSLSSEIHETSSFLSDLVRNASSSVPGHEVKGNLGGNPQFGQAGGENRKSGDDVDSRQLRRSADSAENGAGIWQVKAQLRPPDPGKLTDLTGSGLERSRYEIGTSGEIPLHFRSVNVQQDLVSSEANPGYLKINNVSGSHLVSRGSLESNPGSIQQLGSQLEKQRCFSNPAFQKVFAELNRDKSVLVSGIEAKEQEYNVEEFPREFSFVWFDFETRTAVSFCCFGCDRDPIKMGRITVHIKILRTKPPN